MPSRICQVESCMEQKSSSPSCKEDAKEAMVQRKPKPGKAGCRAQAPNPSAVPQDEWTGYTPRGKDDEIPCRRMRSGSYIKAMGDEDSGDSDTSPKPSPKVAARRESYLKATQPSLTELTTLK
ncbi:hypothetical protein J1605_015213 [Eschrichtius robustus]|uniref:Uncharacterized protein n=1 Tax=Eschrichtius robustus TaxID=9764 RepID=A0AB34GA37_ESCRO|nr:hypothetical protein J1605_015213 [Eschrichtius robustus]